MQQPDYDQFAQVINAVAELHGKKLSEMAIALWWNNLKAYDLAAVREGLSRHMQNPDSGQYMPKPADVIRMIGGTSQDSAMVAWSKVDKGVRQVGTYSSVAFDDPIIHRVLHDMGGWVALGSKTEHEWPFVAKEFENRYRGYRVRNETPDYPKVLIGIAEAQNSTEGCESQPPVLIGDSSKAKQVFLGGTDKVLVGFERMQASDMALLEAPRMRA